MSTSERPRLPERPCPTCGAMVEPLRAAEVVLLEDGYRFLCSQKCRSNFLCGERDHESMRKQRLAEKLRESARAARPRGVRSRFEAGASQATASLRALGIVRPSPPWWGGLAALLGVILGLAGVHSVLGPLAALAILAACVAALQHTWPTRREVGWFGWLIGPLGSFLLALAALSASSDVEARWLMLSAGLATAVMMVRGWLDVNVNAPLAKSVNRLTNAMPERVRVPVGETTWGVAFDSKWVDAASVRAGQEIVVGEGEVVGVDGVVQAGEAYALLHPSSRATLRRGLGDPVLAGARVIDGEIRVLATRVGPERALVRPAQFGHAQHRSSAPLTRLAGRLTKFGGMGALTIAALTLFLSGYGLSVALASAGAVLIAMPLLAIRRASELPYVAAAAAAVERGIAFSSAGVLDRAGRTSVAALCTHGTVTEGSPEVVEVHSVGDFPRRQLIALAAGAEAAVEEQAIAAALIRHAESQGVAPASVRRPVYLPGRGVTAVAPGGESLVVGNRQLLLDEGVSVALADSDAARAEQRGHTVIFIGLDGRVRALVSLRDEPRLGARAAVQRLIDLSVEVLLLSGDHRTTVEAIARTLDIDHIKAELEPDERGAEMRRLRETGGIVAAVGRPGPDESALAGADIPIVLGAAGAPEGERGIALTGEDPRDAAAALWLARAARSVAYRSTISASVLGGALLVLAATGLLPAWLVVLSAAGVDAYALPSALRLLRRIGLRLPLRG